MAIQQLQLLIGFAVAAVISIISRKLRLLTLSGAIASTIVGAIIFGSGTAALPTSLLWFFITSNLLGRFRRRKKQTLGYEKPGARDAGQVLANGAVASIAAMLSVIYPHLRFPLIAASITSIATAASDTWATELGSAFSSRTVLISNFKLVQPGRSGGVSVFGTLAALAGAFLTSCVGFVFGLHSIKVVFIATVCAFWGCILDSVLGATIQVQYRNPDGNIVEQNSVGASQMRGIYGITNDVVNFVSIAIAAIVAFVLVLR